MRNVGVEMHIMPMIFKMIKVTSQHKCQYTSIL